MKSIEQTVNKAIIKNILVDEYEAVTYDGCPSFADYEPDVKNNAWFILKEDDNIAGLIQLESMNLTLWMPHIIIKPEYRGAGSEQWGIQVVDYMKERIKDARFLALTPYESAKKYAERMGFKMITVLTGSIKKNGQLLDQYMLEMK